MKIVRLPMDEFWPMLKKNESKIFKTQSYGPHFHQTPHERSGMEARRKFTKERIELNYVLLDAKGKVAGWCAGFQLNPLDFYMMTSAVFPKYRRSGWYTKLAQTMIADVKKLGFQAISSNHIATNNSIIIAKMKMGFTISGLEISDAMGILLRLTLHLNSVRGEIMKYRTGEIYPTAQVKKILNLKAGKPHAPSSRRKKKVS